MIARNEIGQEKSNLIDKIISEIPEPEANYKNPYEISIWPDDIKKAGYALTTDWHIYQQQFYDKGVDPKKVTLITDKENCVVRTVVLLL